MADAERIVGLGKAAEGQTQPDAEGKTRGGTGFSCRRCGGNGPAMNARPFKGELGEKILATICQACWGEWVRMGTKVINELRLPMHDPQAQEIYDKHMKEFLLLD